MIVIISSTLAFDLHRCCVFFVFQSRRAAESEICEFKFLLMNHIIFITIDN